MTTKNKSKRDRLLEALSKLTPDEEAKEEIRGLADEFRAWADGMPENMQSGDKHGQVEEAADALTELADMLDELTDKVSEAESLEW